MTITARHTVLVPGLGCTSELYDQLLPSVWSHGSATIADTCRDASISGMAERLLASAPERFVLVGFSMGGFVISDVMQRAPERVEALAFISTSSRPDTPEQAARRREHISLIRDGRFEDLTGAVLPDLVGTEMGAFWAQMAKTVGPAVFQAQIEATLARSDYRPALAAIVCPTIVIHGAADRMVPVARAEEFSALIPHAALTVVEGGGHLVMRERPEIVSAAIDSLCASTG